MRILKNVINVVRDVRGISAVEYAILIGVVGVALVGVLSTAGGGIGTYVQSQISTLTSTTTATQTGQ